MNTQQKIKQYLDEIFKPYENNAGIKDLKEELLSNMTDKYNDLVNDGADNENAYKQTIESLGDISEIIESIIDKTNELRERVTWNLSYSHLSESMLDSLDLKSGVFNYSNLVNSDFHNSDLSGSTFKSSDLKNTNFQNANLSKSSFKSCELSGCNFDGAILNSCNITKSNLRDASFKNASLNNANFRYSELSHVSFENMTINGTNFDYSSLKNTSFKNSTLQNVSFKTNLKKTIFDGATMDKVTYALLKGYNADLRNVKVV